MYINNHKRETAFFIVFFYISNVFKKGRGASKRIVLTHPKNAV